VQRRGESPTWNGVEGERSEGLHKRSAEDWGHSLRAPGAALLRRLGFLAGRGAHELLSGTALRAGTGPLRRVAEDAHLWPQTGRTTILPTKNDLRQTDLGQYQDGLGTWIHARWMNESELGRLFGTPPDLMLELRKKLELDSIFNLAERMGGEKIAQLDHLRLNLILETGWRRVGSFRSVLGSTSLPCLVRWP
jgi:hypothetical protein